MSSMIDKIRKWAFGSRSRIEQDSRQPNSISANIATSFVAKAMKTVSDTGKGEAKLYIGPTDDILIFEEFFSHWNASNVFSFERKNLIEYLESMKDEFSSGKYKGASEDYRKQILSSLVNSKNPLTVDMEIYSDKKRVYIRSKNRGRGEKGDGWNIMRSLAIPLMTELEIIKFQQSKWLHTWRRQEDFAEYGLFLWKSGETRNRAHTRRGQAIGLVANTHSRYIPRDLRDRIWRRDNGMCQANWIIDSKLDKNSQERCGSQKKLEFDHIIPYSKNGPTSYANLQLLCKYHNGKKLAKEFPELNQRI